MPRDRPLFPQDQVPGAYYPASCSQYSQNRQQRHFQGPQNFNNHQKRDRARPNFQYSFYSDESQNSNHSSNTIGSIGGSSIASGIGRGSGFKHPPRSKYQNQRHKNERGRLTNNQPKLELSCERLEKGLQNRNEQNFNIPRQMSRDNWMDNKMRYQRDRDYAEDLVQLTIYFCPKCGENYSFRQIQSKYSGKVPLILQCHHTMCQECIYQDLKNNRIKCPTCKFESTLTQEQTPVCQTDMQCVFPPNLYVLGVMTYRKTIAGHQRNVENIGFVSTQSKKPHPVLPDVSDCCCFVTCTKEATKYCPDCGEIYCSDCCTAFHKSTTKRMAHEPVPRHAAKFTLNLEKCGVHSEMELEFLCKDCNLTTCCYCALNNHNGHERIELYLLDQGEMEEFKKLQGDAESVLKQILATQKKTTRLANFNTEAVKKDICQYFADFHARLQKLEKKLCDGLENIKTNTRGLDNIQSSLMASAEQLKQLVAFDTDKIGGKKQNSRGVLDKLRNLDSIPRFLLDDVGQVDPVRFVVNTDLLNNIEEELTIEKCEDCKYRLVTEKDLPEDYPIPIETDTEIEEALSGILNKSNQSADMGSITSRMNELPTMITGSSTNSLKSQRTQKYTKTKEQGKRKLDMEKVDIQHINSMDSFFVQYKHDQSKLNQLNKQIEDYVKMGGANNVADPQLNELYLALYVSDSHGSKEQKWCRSRLTTIKNGENGPQYEMFFIDYGKTQFVDRNRIRDIPSYVAQKKPFAIECMLHNPMDVYWNKKAHYQLARILNGKEIYMSEKSYNKGIYEVDLMIASSDGGITSVNDILIHAHNSVESMDDVGSSAILRKDGYIPTLKVFPNSKRFTKNQKEKVTLATVIDPYNIFIHLAQHNDAFKAMCHSIKKTYKQARSRGCIPIEGTYVLVEYIDNLRSNWHRGFIKNVDITRDKVQVLLVDWGLSVEVSTNDIRPLPESFTILESQAVLVKLTHIAPYDKQGVWSRYATNFLKTYHQAQDVLKMVVQETGPEVEVALFDINGNVDICLNAMMVENNLADSTGPVSTKLEWPQFEITNSQFSEDDGLISSLLKKVDEEANNDSENEDLAGVKKRQVDVIKVESPDLIWVKFLELKEKESTMFRELQLYYSGDEKTTKTSWNVGEHCVTELGHHYVRGKILEQNGDLFKIFLLDKAKEIDVQLDKVYVYNTYFSKFPQAAMKCHLANLKPAGGNKWSISSLELLQEVFEKHQRIYANTTSESDTCMAKKSLPVDMWYALVIPGGALDPDKVKFVSINNRLVKLGYAFKVSAPSSIVTQAEVHSNSSSNEFRMTSPVRKVATGEDLLKVEKCLMVFDDITKEAIKEKSSEGFNMNLTSSDTQTKMDTKENTTKKSNLFGSQLDDNVEQISELDKPTEGDIEGKTSDNEKINKMEAGVEQPESNDRNPLLDNDEDTNANWNSIVEKELGLTEDESEEQKESIHHTNEVAIYDWFPPFRLTKNDFRARVTCVETSGNLYLHEEAIDDAYYTMEANIKKYFDANPPKNTDDSWEPGNLCTIKYTDGNWYRGRVLKVKSPNELNVFMIDFGSDHDVSPDVLFREVLYTEVGSFATKVKLDKVYAKSGSWLPSDYDHFHDLVTDWCRIVVKGPINVEQPLVDVYNEEGVLVNQKLVEICPNLSRCANFPMERVGENEDINPMESIECDEPYGDEILMDNLDRKLDFRRSPVERSVISDVDENQEHKIRPLPEVLEGGKVAFAGVISDVDENQEYKFRPLPEVLFEGGKVMMEIGGITSFDKVALRVSGEKICPELFSLVSDIQDVVDDLPNLKEFKVDTPCLAPFSEDGIYYRARITGTKNIDLGYVDVIFVDYGNSEAVSTNTVKVIPRSYLELPQQSWEAALNVCLSEGADVMSVMKLINYLDRKNKYVKLVNTNPLTVDLYEKNGKLCYDTLIITGTMKPLLEGEIS